LKYVIDGVINYQLDSELFEVGAGCFLIADKRNDVSAYFRSSLPTKSICIDINSEVISEAATVMSAKEDFDFETYLAKYYKHSIFCEKVYSSKDNQIAHKLASLANSLIANEEFEIDSEWFLDAAELIILQEKGNYLALNGIRSVKASTRIETFHRLNKAKEYMNEVFLRNPEIAEVAINCAMSEFHFFRSFKQAFGITPYQYLLKKRLVYSKTLLEKKIPAKEIASTCGFADVFTYSKAFKREFGMAPTTYQRSI
jgi:AraC-like DNA-binding protein